MKAGSDYMGWGFNLTDPADPADPIYYWADGSLFGGCKRARNSFVPDLSTTAGQDRYKRFPLFDMGVGPETGCSRWHDPTRDFRGPSWIYELFGASTGHAIAADPEKHTQLLNEAIPALSVALGSTTSTAMEELNYNMPEIYAESGWPRDIDPDVNLPDWHHSDMREVAYLYMYKFYDKLGSIANQ